MLSEDNRDYIIDDLHDNLLFKHMEFTPIVDVYRYGEGVELENPYILVEFLPANRNKFRSISDVIGNATPSGQYKQYGFCQLEMCSIYCYSGEFHKDYNLNGRKLTYALAEQVLTYIQKNWESILWSMYASLDRAESLWFIRDVSYYDQSKGSKVYCYSIDVYIRTQMRWNKVPDTFEEEDVVEQTMLYMKHTDEEEFSIIKHIDVS